MIIIIEFPSVIPTRKGAGKARSVAVVAAVVNKGNGSLASVPTKTVAGVTVKPYPPGERVK